MTRDDRRYTAAQRAMPLRALVFSLRTRFMLWYGAVLALILLLCSGAVYATEQQLQIAQLDRQLATHVQLWATTYDLRTGRLAVSRDPAVAQGSEIVLLLTPDGHIIQTLAAGQMSAIKAPWSQIVQTLAAVARDGVSTTIEQGLLLRIPAAITKDGITPLTTEHAALYRISGTSLHAGNQLSALLVVGLQSDVPQQLATLTRTLEIVMPLILILCVGSGYWLVNRALYPIRVITRTAQEIRVTDLHRRLNLQSRDEVGQLAATLDDMFARLDASIERQRQFTADASHELRTPLTILDLEATRALARPHTVEDYRQTIRVMHDETAQMSRLVDDLLLLARADNGDGTTMCAELDLAELVLDVVERLAPLALRSAMTLTIETLPELLVYGDREALTRMLLNLVENSLKHGAGHGTHVRLSGGVRRDHSTLGVWLKLEDNGPGISAEHLPHVCERFYRVDRARTPMSSELADKELASTGSGLGLAISQWIISDHGGTLEIHSPHHQGVVIEIWLPACDGP